MKEEGPMPAATAIRGDLTWPRMLLAQLTALPFPIARVSPPALRTADGHDRDERRASWIELFFDLVFAGAVSQLAGAFQHHPSLGMLARFVLLFTPIWWLWVQLTFYADRHESEDTVHRAAFLTAILLCVGLAASAPRALAGQSTAFVMFFVGLRAVQLVLYARARRHLPATKALYTRFLIFFGLGGAFWAGSLAVAGPARCLFWAAGLLIDAVGAIGMTTPRRRVPLNPSHLSDRFQIFVLIVLGESVARLISAATARPWSLQLAVVLGAALLTLAAIWRAWLTAADRRALDGPRPIAVFTALNLPIVAGIAAGSAGLHIAILAADGASTIGFGPRAALYGGVFAAMLASAWFPSGRLSWSARATRAVTAMASLGLVFMGAIVVPVYLVPALTGILVVGLAVESHPSWVTAMFGRSQVADAAQDVREVRLAEAAAADAGQAWADDQDGDGAGAGAGDVQTVQIVEELHAARCVVSG
jgi:low temperature requirement protein LtrA